MTVWDLAPYVDAVLSQSRSTFANQAMAMLQRARHEIKRARVRERALLHFHMLQSSVMVRNGTSLFNLIAGISVRLPPQQQ